MFVAICKGGKGVVSAAPAPAAPDPVAAPAAPAPAGGKVVAPLDATPGKPPTSNHQQHSDQLSVTTPAGQQDTAGAGYGGARATASPAALSRSGSNSRNLARIGSSVRSFPATRILHVFGVIFETKRAAKDLLCLFPRPLCIQAGGGNSNIGRILRWCRVHDTRR